MDSATPQSGWQAFERLQHSLQNTHYVNATVMADDEALTELLDDFDEQEPSAEQVNRRFYSLGRNRRRKFRVRDHLFAAHCAESRYLDVSEKTENPCEKAEQSDLLMVIQSKISTTEWTALRGLAAGATYETLAQASGCSAGKLRIQVFRLRETIRAVA